MKYNLETKQYTAVHRDRNKLLVRGYDEEGNRTTDEVWFNPVLFRPSKTETGYFDMHRNPLQREDFDSMSKASAWMKETSYTVYGQNRFPYQFLSHQFRGCEIPSTDSIKIAYIDIETECESGFPHPEQAAERINIITVVSGGTVVSFGLHPWEQDNSRVEIGRKVNYFHSETEFDLLHQFLKYWKYLDPDVITGWHTSGFDIPYIVNRVEKVLGEGKSNLLSPFDNVRSREVMVNNKPTTQYTIAGIAGIDYLDLYKKFAGFRGQLPTYKLDYVAELELGKKKVDYSEHDSFKDFYTNDWEKFVDYNVIDTCLVQEIDNKLRFLQLTLNIVYDTTTLIGDIFTTVRPWDNKIYTELHRKNIIVPAEKRSKMTVTEKYPGAYVHEPVPNKYKWIMSFDVSSMYPHIMEQWGISPENLPDEMSEEDQDKILNEAIPGIDGVFDIEERGEIIFQALVNKRVNTDVLKEHGVTLSSNGTLFKAKDGIIGKLVMDVFGERKQIRKQLYSVEQEIEQVKAEIEKRGL